MGKRNYTVGVGAESRSPILAEKDNLHCAFSLEGDEMPSVIHVFGNPVFEDVAPDEYVVTVLTGEDCELHSLLKWKDESRLNGHGQKIHLSQFLKEISLLSVINMFLALVLVFADSSLQNISPLYVPVIVLGSFVLAGFEMYFFLAFRKVYEQTKADQRIDDFLSKRKEEMGSVHVNRILFALLNAYDPDIVLEVERALKR